MGARIRDVVLALGLAAAALTPAFAGWREVASQPDADRLVRLPDIRSRAMNAALNYRGQGDLNALRSVEGAQGRTVPARELVGNWHCRQMKVGGMTPYLVYPTWFACNIRVVNGNLLLQKVTGTQRTIGFLYPENGGWVYLGASSTIGEPWHDYSGRTPSIGADVTPDDQIGMLTGIGNNHLRLEIPAVQESLLDVIELAR